MANEAGQAEAKSDPQSELNQAAIAFADAERAYHWACSKEAGFYEHPHTKESVPWKESGKASGAWVKSIDALHAAHKRFHAAAIAYRKTQPDWLRIERDARGLDVLV